MPASPSATDDRPHGDGSTELQRHRWAPFPDAPTRPRGVYLLHGVGEHGARYDRLAQRLTAEGWPVGGHDHPGHGRSGGPRGRLPVEGTYMSRAHEECARFAEETGAAPFLFGHSLGGVVACELALAHPGAVAGLVLSAPAIAPRLNAQQALKLRTLSLLAPRLVLELPYEPENLTHDPEQQRVALADPWIHRFKSAEKIGWLMRAGAALLETGAGLDLDVLVLVADDDVVVDNAATHRFAERLPAGRATVLAYEGAHHELLNEGPELRGRVEDDVVRWLDARA